MNQSHADLCAPHIDEQRARFHDVHEFELGQCTDNCPVK